MNIPNARKLVSQLQRLPDEKFYMGVFQAHPEDFENYEIDRPASCGTVACIAGWALALNGGYEKSDSWEEFSAHWLGLSRDKAHSLFFGRWSRKGLNDITRQEAIDELNRLIAAEVGA